MVKNKKYKIILIGASAGGVQALRKIIPELPNACPVPVIVVQHLHPQQDEFHVDFLDQMSKVKVEEALDKTPIETGHVYFAPPNYHLLVENDKSLGLTVENRVSHSIPSIDVLFQSAADVYKDSTLAIILTGANADGASGIKYIKELGGTTIAQNPEEAATPFMPQAAISTGKVDMVMSLEEIANYLKKLTIGSKEREF